MEYMNNVDDMIIHDLKQVNIKFQSESKYVVCIEQPNHIYLQLVPSNTILHWIDYFTACDSRVYSKGMDRLHTWLELSKSELLHNSTTIPLSVKYFVLSGFIILLQVYGDGNHRTASYLYQKYTNYKLNIDLIKQVKYEFNQERIDINEIILQLISVYKLY